jgi:hypothetical protein
VTVPEFTFLTVDGGGDPNTSLRDAAGLSVLYVAAYTLKVAVREALGIDYRVLPLEGPWGVAPSRRLHWGRQAGSASPHGLRRRRQRADSAPQPYATEAPTIARLRQFIAASVLRPRDKHHEIYLSDPDRTRPGRMRTVIRQP